MLRFRLGSFFLALTFIAAGSTAAADSRFADSYPSGCGTPLMSTDPAPVAIAECNGIRPGAWTKSASGRCTFNFVFDGSDGRTYIGTAGHCLEAEGSENSWTAGTGPQAEVQASRLEGAANVSGWSRAGEYAYRILNRDFDFALIRVDAVRTHEVVAAMCHFGGPTAYNDDIKTSLLNDGPTVYYHFGNGVGTGTTVPGRSMLATAMPDESRIGAYGTGTFGDSGSGVISADGRAVGVLVTLGASGGTNGITRLREQVVRAQSVLGITLTLRTAPLSSSPI